MENNSNRKILHIDMDAFYASVEQRDRPELRGKPIAVGGGETRGVTTTASYEARKFGVRSAMSGYKAKQLCPQLIFVKPRFDVYKQVSLEIRNIFLEYTETIEPLSLDEAFLDVTTNKMSIPYGMEVAKEIMRKVKTRTDLTCSAGVSYCKFLAKVASGYKKPNGLTVITPKRAERFLEDLDIKDFFGVGKVTAKKMERMGILKGKDLKRFSKIELAQNFGKMGQFYYDIVRGIDNRPVIANRTRKSIGIETTFESDLTGFEEMEAPFLKLIEGFIRRLKRINNYGRTITLKLKTSSFQTHTRSLSKNYFIKNEEEIKRLSLKLLEENLKDFDQIRLIGLSTTNLEKSGDDQSGYQLTFAWEE